MIIALDYDDTFTRDPEAWFKAMTAMIHAGHTVIGVTMRYPREAFGMSSEYNMICSRIYFTGRQAKKPFLDSLDVLVDVWIDDNPIWIVTDAR